MFAIILLLQAELGEASTDENPEAEPLSLELSMLAGLMILSVLFIWESARRDGLPAVRMVNADDEDDQRQVRRERRQENVRRAIVRELDGEGLRQRSGQVRDQEQPRPPDLPFLRVQVETQPYPPALDLPPPVTPLAFLFFGTRYPTLTPE